MLEQAAIGTVVKIVDARLVPWVRIADSIDRAHSRVSVVDRVDNFVPRGQIFLQFMTPSLDPGRMS